MCCTRVSINCHCALGVDQADPMPLECCPADLTPRSIGELRHLRNHRCQRSYKSPPNPLFSPSARQVMSRLSTAFALARSVCVRMPRAGISRIVPPQPIVRPVLTARFRSTSTKPSAAPPVDTPPPAEESVGAAELFDQVEIDGAEWEGEEVEEGVFISAVSRRLSDT